MKRQILYITVCFALIVSACSSPAPVTTGAPAHTSVVEQATATTSPTEVPTEVPPTSTPEPTATPVPEPQPLTAGNVSGIALSNVVEVPRQTGLITEFGANGIMGAYTPDGETIILRTDTGVDVLSSETLELTKTFPGLYLANVTLDGRFIAAHNNGLVIVDPVSGEQESIETDAPLTGLFAVSPTGNQVVSYTEEGLARLYTLDSDTITDLPYNDYLNALFFTGDGAYLILGTFGGGTHFQVYDTATGEKLYDRPAVNPPVFSLDGQYFVVQDSNGATVSETATGKALNSIGGHNVIQSGCNGNECHDQGVYLASYFLAGGPELAVTTWIEYNALYAPGATGSAVDYTETSSSFVQDLLTGVQKISFSGYSPDDIAQGIGKPDGSAFLLVKTNGELFQHSATNGELLAQSDQYTVGGRAHLSPNGSLVGWSNLKEVTVYDWQAGDVLLQQPHTVKMWEAFITTFAGGDRLLTSTITNDFGIAEEVWDITAGQLETSLDGLQSCKADNASIYLLCYVPGSNTQRILALDDPNRIVFSGTDPYDFTSISPAGDSYVTCTTGSNSMTYKNYETGSVSLKSPCQAAAYSADGTMLVLQNGQVVSLPSGEVLVTLKLDEGQLAFGPQSPTIYFGTDIPATYFGSEIIVVNNRVFDAESADLLVELPISNVWGLSLSEDGMTLNILTPQGMEQWQVTQ